MELVCVPTKEWTKEMEDYANGHISKDDLEIDLDLDIYYTTLYQDDEEVVTYFRIKKK